MAAKLRDLSAGSGQTVIDLGQLDEQRARSRRAPLDLRQPDRQPSSPPSDRRQNRVNSANQPDFYETMPGYAELPQPWQRPDWLPTRAAVFTAATAGLDHARQLLRRHWQLAAMVAALIVFVVTFIILFARPMPQVHPVTINNGLARSALSTALSSSEPPSIIPASNPWRWDCLAKPVTIVRDGAPATTSYAALVDANLPVPTGQGGYGAGSTTASHNASSPTGSGSVIPSTTTSGPTAAPGTATSPTGSTPTTVSTPSSTSLPTGSVTSAASGVPSTQTVPSSTLTPTGSSLPSTTTLPTVSPNTQLPTTNTPTATAPSLP